MRIHYVGYATELDKDGNSIGTWIPGEWLAEGVMKEIEIVRIKDRKIQLKEELKTLVIRFNIHASERDITEFARVIWEMAWNQCVKDNCIDPEKGIVRGRDENGKPII